MSDLLLYLIKANVALALFCLGYYLLLRKLTFYGINRYYLVFALAFSALYPAIPIDQWFAVNQDAPPQLLLTLSDWQQLQLPQKTNNFSSVFSSAYWISIGLFGLLFLIKLMGIGRIHLRSVPAQWDRFAYRKINEIISPFSFWTNIYFNPLLHSEDEYEKIFSHEQVHVRQLHSLDVLLVEIALIFFWYNPFCWLIRKAIQENIEFITDRRVLSLGIDKKSYQYSLVQISTSSNPSYLGSHFNFKNLKKRIIMMNKKQSSKIQLGKYLFILPTVILGSLIFGVSKAYEKKDIPENLHKYTLTDLNVQEPIILEEKDKMADQNEASKPVMDTLPSGAQPIIVVDGVFHSETNLGKLDSEKIQSMDVIIDAAAHNIYGSKAQNGIIKVTTQKEEPLYVVNGVKQTADRTRNYLPEEIAFVNVLKDKTAVDAYGNEGKNGVIEITTKRNNAEDIRSSALQDTLKTNDPLYVVDGKKQNSMDKINTETIESVSVLKGKAAIDLYGEEGKNGVVLVTTKKGVKEPLVEEVSSPANPSITIATSSKGTVTKQDPDKEPVVIGIKNNKITSLEGADENVLIYVDGKKLTRNDLSRLDPDNFESVNVFKGKTAIERYGEEGKDGVIEFTTKSNN